MMILSEQATILFVYAPTSNKQTAITYEAITAGVTSHKQNGPITARGATRTRQAHYADGDLASPHRRHPTHNIMLKPVD